MYSKEAATLAPSIKRAIRLGGILGDSKYGCSLVVLIVLPEAVVIL